MKKMKCQQAWSLIFMIVLFYLPSYSLNHQHQHCGSSVLKKQGRLVYSPQSIVLKPHYQIYAENRRILSQSSHKIRIQVQYQYLTQFIADNRALEPRAKLAKEITSSVIEFFHENLMVYNEELITIPAGIIFPYDDKLYEYAPVTDGPFDLIVLVIPSYEETDWFAAATIVGVDSRNNRPLLGVYLLNLQPLIEDTKVDKYKLFSTFAHEFTHILGFMDEFDVFPRTFTPKGNGKFDLQPINTVIKNWNIGGTNYTSMIFPKLLEYAKKYFDCDVIKGVPLENGGGDGSKNSHWEKTFLPMEYMNPGVEFPAVLSEFTFLFLEGTNWYRLSEDHDPQYFDWGKGDRCKHFKACPEGKEYCPSADYEKISCSHDYRSYATCLNWSTFMGDCMIKKTWEEIECVIDNNYAPSKRPDEYYGPHSRCVLTELNSSENPLPTCYKSACVGNTIKFRRTNDPNTYTCSYENQRIEVSRTQEIICPSISDFCNYFSKRCPLDCMGHGFCLKSQKCFCQVGFEGPDCNTCSNCSPVTDKFVQDRNILNNPMSGFQQPELNQKDVNSFGEYSKNSDN